MQNHKKNVFEKEIKFGTNFVDDNKKIKKNMKNEELETGVINPQVERELRLMGFTDKYFRNRRVGILAAKKMSKRSRSSEEMVIQMLENSKRN